MKKYEKIYNRLKRDFSDEEIVERYVIPDDLSEEEQQQLEEEIKNKRFKLLKERTEKQRLLGELMRMKLLIQDYLKSKAYDEAFSFSNQLNEYIRIIDRPKKKFAQEIDIHPTRLSRILNDREKPNIELVYRLEKHCGNKIPAIYWWKLHSKKLEEEIKKDNKTREKEGISSSSSSLTKCR